MEAMNSNNRESCPTQYRELLLGCGRDRKKRYSAVPHHPRTWTNPKGPVTLDINKAVAPDLWCDLNQAPPWHAWPQKPLYQDTDSIALERSLGITGEFREHSAGAYTQAWTLESDYWDEIHAYQVLEHLGRQGDAHALFAQFSELWRLLKPGGYLVAEVPSRFSGGLWGDPGHARAIVEDTLPFLDQAEYARQIDGPESARTTMSDYRDIYKADFRCLQPFDNRVNFVFVLQAVKPARLKTP